MSAWLCPLVMAYWGWIVCASFLLMFTVYTGTLFAFGEIIIFLSADKEIAGSLASLGKLLIYKGTYTSKYVTGYQGKSHTSS